MRSSPFVKKLITSYIAGLTCAALLLILGNSGSIAWFPPVVVFSLVGFSLLAATVFPFIWQQREDKGVINSDTIYSFLHAFIRCCIAFNLASFGFKKLLGLQFVVPAEIASIPMNKQTGEWLTWYYFGYSSAFGAIIAFIQIVVSYLLLFKRTMLLAAIILFAFMINLSLINIFYEMNAGALLQSVVVTLALLFLILLEYKSLVEFFLQAKSSLPTIVVVRPGTKNIIRVSTIIFSFLFTLYLQWHVK